jgi:hypothetical protein
MKAKLSVKPKTTSVGREDDYESPEKVIAQAASRKTWLIALSATAFCLAVYLLRLDRAAGLAVDDAWYTLLGQALATGQGYTLINSPSPGILPLYPPFFPLLLALVFKVAPEFPSNVLLLKLVSVAAMFAAGAVSYRYLTRYRGMKPLAALLAALVVVLNPALAFLATSTLMSECVFLLLQLLAVVCLERCVSEGAKKSAWGFALLGAGLVAAAYLTRSAGVVLAVGGLAYLLKERLWRPAAVFALGLGLIIGPWMIYAQIHAPTPAQRAEQNSYIVIPYSESFWMRSAGDTSLKGKETLADIPWRVLDNFSKIGGREAARILFPTLYRSPKMSGMEAFKYGSPFAWPGFISWALFALMAAGFVAALRKKITFAEVLLPPSLALIALWPWEPLRFLLPLLPFLIFYLFGGLQLISRLAPRTANAGRGGIQGKALVGVAACVVAFSIYDHAAYLIAKFSAAPQGGAAWLEAHRANEAALNWMRDHLRPEMGVIATPNPALVYLHTGIKTVASTDPDASWEQWKDLNVRHLAFVGRASPFDKPEIGEAAFPTLYQSNFMVYGGSELSLALRASQQAAKLFGQGLSQSLRQEGGYNIRVLDLGPPAARRGWGAGNKPPLTALIPGNQ